MKDEITIKIDVSKIKEDMEKYVYRKMQEAVKEHIDRYASDINFPRIQYPDIEGRLEKLEDFKKDVEQDWIRIKKQ